MGALTPDSYWLHVQEEPYELRSGIEVVGGPKSKQRPDDADYSTMLEAMRDPRSEFDCLREPFFIPDHDVNARRVAITVYDIASSRDDGEACLALADGILSILLDYGQCATTWSHELESVAIITSVQTLATTS